MIRLKKCDGDCKNCPMHDEENCEDDKDDNKDDE